MVSPTTDLALVGRHRRGIDDDPALTRFADGLQSGHLGSSQPQHVEGADQVHGNNSLERVERHGAIAPDDALRRGDPRAAHADAHRAVPLTRAGDGPLEPGGVGDVADEPEAADLRRDGGHRLLVEVDDRHLRPARGEKPRRRSTHTGRAARDDRAVAVDLHGFLPGRWVLRCALSCAVAGTQRGLSSRVGWR
jgi:hypothetical protein